MDKSNIEYLENCLKHTSKQHNLILEGDKLWYMNGDTLLSVARILDSECYFTNASEAIDFFEKPYNGEYDMREIIETYKEELEDNDGGETT